MSDFDAALERLVSDPAFRDALAADPARALAGYHLEPDELDLLNAQIDMGTGGQRHVEQRTSKASLFGLLSPMGGGGTADTVDALHGGGSGTEGFGSSGGAASPAYAPVDDAGFGSGGGGAQEGFGSAGQEGFGPAAGGGSGSDGSLGSTFGGVVGGDEVPGRSPDYIPEPAPSQGTMYGSAAASGTDHFTSSQPPADYHTRVDADGDGRWDQYTATDRGDQGVDLGVDRDGDGRAEFVGHDYNRDGIIDAADTDEDHDGRLDTRWVDDNGDGWLDRRTAMPADAPPAEAPPPPDQAGRGFER
jgi:hypothetical protein